MLLVCAPPAIYCDGKPAYVTMPCEYLVTGNMDIELSLSNKSLEHIIGTVVSHNNLILPVSHVAHGGVYTSTWGGGGGGDYTVTVLS